MTDITTDITTVITVATTIVAMKVATIAMAMAALTATVETIGSEAESAGTIGALDTGARIGTGHATVLDAATPAMTIGVHPGAIIRDRGMTVTNLEIAIAETGEAASGITKASITKVTGTDAETIVGMEIGSGRIAGTGADTDADRVKALGRTIARTPVVEKTATTAGTEEIGTIGIAATTMRASFARSGRRKHFPSSQNPRASRRR